MTTRYDFGQLGDSTRVSVLEHGRVDGLLGAQDSRTVDISEGGRVDWFRVPDSNTVNVSGRSVDERYAYESSTLNSYSSAFRAGGGNPFGGQRVLGAGTLEGKSADGAWWAVNPGPTRPSATILAIPEPSTLPC